MFKMFNNLFKKVRSSKKISENAYAQVLLESCDDVGCESHIGDTFTVNFQDLYEGKDYILFSSNEKKTDLLMFCSELRTVYDETLEKCRYYLTTPCGNYVFRYVGCDF